MSGAKMSVGRASVSAADSLLRKQIIPLIKGIIVVFYTFKKRNLAIIVLLSLAWNRYLLISTATTI